MKKWNIAFGLSVCCLAAFSQAPADKIIFKGTADTAYNGRQIVLYNKATKDHDSATVVNGRFELIVKYKEPSVYFFYSKFELAKNHGYAPFGVLVPKAGEVTFKADMESLGKSVIGNDPENDLYLSFTKAGMPARQKMADQMSGKFGAETMQHLSQKDPRFAEISKYYEQLNKDNDVLESSRLEVFAKRYPGSFTAMYLLSRSASGMPGEKAQEIYNLLDKSYKNTVYAERVINVIDAGKITAIGKIAPDFQQPDTAGKMVKLSDFRGKYVLVDFWASWCGPCRAENPNVVKAYQQYNAKGFTVLGISLDQPGKKEAWLNAIHQDHLSWTQVSDLQFWNNAVAKLYGIQAIPQNFLLDEAGKIIAVNIQGEELNKKLAEIFKD